MIIGIAGASRAGKSTLANLIATDLRKQSKRVIIFHQDDFVNPETEIPTINGRIDWESPQSIDHELYREVLFELNEKFDVVIAEGIFAFYDEAFFQALDKKLFVQISRDAFLQRKAKDDRWGTEPLWFVEHIWQSYLKHGRINADNEGVIMVNGEEKFDISTIMEQVLNKATRH